MRAGRRQHGIPRHIGIGLETSKSRKHDGDRRKLVMKEGEKVKIILGNY